MGLLLCDFRLINTFYDFFVPEKNAKKEYERKRSDELLMDVVEKLLSGRTELTLIQQTDCEFYTFLSKKSCVNFVCGDEIPY